MKAQDQIRKDERQPELNFGGGGAVAIAGAISGVVIAVGVPWVLLAQGQSLGAGTLTTLIIIALAVGGLVSLTAAFFGLVMPRHMHGPWLDPERWQRMAERKQQWREARWRMMSGWAQGGEDGPADPPGPRRRRR